MLEHMVSEPDWLGCIVISPKQHYYNSGARCTVLQIRNAVQFIFIITAIGFSYTSPL